MFAYTELFYMKLKPPTYAPCSVAVNLNQNFTHGIKHKPKDSRKQKTESLGIR